MYFQTSVDCVEGNKIRSFYNVKDYPYIAILDPRTGEEQISYKGFFKYTPDGFSKEMLAFLHDNYTPDYIDTGKTPTKYTQDSQGTSSDRSSAVCDLQNIISLTEEEQLEIAIKKSMEEAATATTMVSDSEDDFDEDVGTDNENSLDRPPPLKKAKVATNNHESDEEENNSTGPQTKLMIRLPDGQNEVIQRGSTTTIGGLLKFLQKKYREKIGSTTCKVYCPAVRKELCDMDKKLTLEAAKLHPSAVLHISSEE